ncbi:MAG TPA: hypothetical protein VJ770_22985 [Stellaceae bacterium]|nr:hypothetical protein [Stellaceae bacterium]
MAAVVSPPPPEDPTFDHLVTVARDRLQHAEGLARLNGDPAEIGYGVLLALLDAVAGFHAAERNRVELQGHGRNWAVEYRAEIARAHADLASTVADRIAQAAGGALRTMARTSYLWAAAAAVGAALLAFVAGCATGYLWGSDAATRTYLHADATLHAVAVEEGPRAVRDWDALMRYNPIELLMAGCKGDNLAIEDGSRGCHMWLRIDPPIVRSQGAKKGGARRLGRAPLRRDNQDEGLSP